MKPEVIRRTLAALLLTAPVVPAAAQVTIRTGSRVRLEAPSLLSERIEGTLAAARGDSVTIHFEERWNAPKTTALTLPASAVTKIEMRAGRSRGRRCAWPSYRRVVGWGSWSGGAEEAGHSARGGTKEELFPRAPSC